MFKQIIEQLQALQDTYKDVNMMETEVLNDNGEAIKEVYFCEHERCLRITAWMPEDLID